MFSNLNLFVQFQVNIDLINVNDMNYEINFIVQFQGYLYNVKFVLNICILNCTFTLYFN